MRVRFAAPRGSFARVRFLDSVHAALVNAWTAGGVEADAVVGHGARNWSFGAVGTATPGGVLMKSLVVGAEDASLVPTLGSLTPEAVRKTSVNGDVVDLSGWSRMEEDLPLVCEPGRAATLPAIMLSPLALSVRGQKGRWHDDLGAAGEDLDDAVNSRLSRLTGRSVRLRIEPDRLYIRANPKHSTLVRTRAVPGGKTAFVIGMMCPLFITGRIEDLRSAWRLGIGEKNRYGFGCVGYAGRRP